MEIFSFIEIVQLANKEERIEVRLVTFLHGTWRQGKRLEASCRLPGLHDTPSKTRKQHF